MIFFKTFFISFFLFFFSYVSCSEFPLNNKDFLKNKSSHFLFLIQTGKIDQAINVYRQITNQIGKHDLELLQEIGMGLLNIGSLSKDSEISLLSILGAGISLNEKAIPILEQGIKNDNPQSQLISLNFLSNYHHSDAKKAFEVALRSQFLPIRLEAAFHLCNSKEKSAFAHSESLMNKLGPSLAALFPQFFSAIGDAQSIRILKQLLNHSNVNVRVEAIVNIVKFHRDELLPSIRTLSTHQEVPQQEACAFALGQFRDQLSLPILESLMESKSSSVKLAALYSLFLLGKKEAQYPIIKAASEGNCFAINLLSQIPETENVLYLLTLNNNLNIRLNATMALLEHHDSRSLKGLYEILIRDSKDLAFIPVTSHGKSLISFKVIPSATENLKTTPILLEISLKKREEALTKAADLNEDIFLKIAESIFINEQNDLIPLTIRLLENLQTEKSIELLKTYSQKIGSPLIRNYCNLALYRMGESGPYFENLKNWILVQQHTALIRFRPFVPLSYRTGLANYQMTPEETSKLLVESFESFLQVHDDRGINILIDTIQNGNKNNKFILAGLLMRATL